MATSTSQDRLRDASKALLDTLGDRALGVVEDKVNDLASRMESMAENGGVHMSDLPKAGLKGALDDGASAVKDTASKVKGVAPSPGDAASGVLEAATSAGGAVAKTVGKVKDAVPGLGSGKSGGSETKVTTIIEEIDVGVPISLAYDQWTEFGSFPSFMKKVENVDAVEDQRLKWKAQIWWSHREWESTILEQKPEERIVWKSEGEKGYVDGAVTFHELTPDLTRIIVVLEYHPQGLFERTANLWRAQGRRVRAELQHFRRHVMAHTVLDPDSVQGWRGVIEDGEVVEGPDEDDEDEYDDAEDELDEDDEDDEDDDEDLDEDLDEDEEDEEDEDDVDEEPEDEYDDEDELDDEEDDDEDLDEDDEDDEDEYADDESTDAIDDEYEESAR